VLQRENAAQMRPASPLLAGREEDRLEELPYDAKGKVTLELESAGAEHSCRSRSYSGIATLIAFAGRRCPATRRLVAQHLHGWHSPIS
jgi:hypothetical protein